MQDSLHNDTIFQFFLNQIKKREFRQFWLIDQTLYERQYYHLILDDKTDEARIQWCKEKLIFYQQKQDKQFVTSIRDKLVKAAETEAILDKIFLDNLQPVLVTQRPEPESDIIYQPKSKDAAMRLLFDE